MIVVMIRAGGTWAGSLTRAVSRALDARLVDAQRVRAMYDARSEAADELGWVGALGDELGAERSRPNVIALCGALGPDERRALWSRCPDSLFVVMDELEPPDSTGADEPWQTVFMASEGEPEGVASKLLCALAERPRATSGPRAAPSATSAPRASGISERASDDVSSGRG